MAYEIFRIPYVVRVRSNEKVKWASISNGSAQRPVKGSVIIWKSGGYFEMTGHVAIITEVTEKYVRVAEQNTTDSYWPRGQDWGRQLPVKVSQQGLFTIVEDHKKGGQVLGWMNFPTDFKPDPVLPVPIEKFTR